MARWTGGWVGGHEESGTLIASRRRTLFEPTQTGQRVLSLCGIKHRRRGPAMIKYRKIQRLRDSLTDIHIFFFGGVGGVGAGGEVPQ